MLLAVQTEYSTSHDEKSLPKVLVFDISVLFLIGLIPQYLNSFYYRPILRSNESGTIPVLMLWSRLWYFDNLHPHAAYNVQIVCMASVKLYNIF